MNCKLKNGKYLITLKTDVEPIIDNIGEMHFQNDKEYHMIIKDDMCYIENNNPNEYNIFVPYKNLLEYFNVKEVV